jgi:transcriptional regulator with GAF, ATPase, and Fis domain
VLIVNKATKKLTVKAFRGFRQENIDAEKRLEEKIGNLVAKRAEPLVLHEAEVSPSLWKESIGAGGEAAEEIATYFTEVKSQIGVSDLLSVPIVFEDRVIGVLNCAKTKEGALFTSSDLEFLSILNSQAAIAIENVRLFKNIQRQKLQLRKLLGQITLAQENERKRVEDETGATGHFTVSGAPARLSSNLEITIYRVIQEALLNVKKRATATEVGVKLEFQPTQVFAEICDNGRRNCPLSISLY